MSEKRKTYAEEDAGPDDILFLSSNEVGVWKIDESLSLSLTDVAQLLSELDPDTRLKLATAEAKLRLGVVK